MKSPRTALVATAVSLLLTSLRVTAGELPFNVPTTERAKEAAPFLHQAARALDDSSSAVTTRLVGAKHISNLWLFPTADAGTVFARYNLTPSQETISRAERPVAEHLTVLTLDGNRIVESHELTSSATDSVAKHSASLDRSAAIGTGYAAHPEVTNTSTGVPATLHWTASVGTGTAASSIATVHDTKQPSPSTSRPTVAAADWTSRIGRGDARQASTPVVHGSFVR